MSLSVRIAAIVLAILLLLAFVVRNTGKNDSERSTISPADSAPGPDIGEEHLLRRGGDREKVDGRASSEIPGAVETPGSVNPTIDRFGIPVTTSYQLEPEDVGGQSSADYPGRSQRVGDGATADGAVTDVSGGGPASINAGNEAVNLRNADISTPDDLGSLPEESDQGNLGSAPESSGPQFPQLPPAESEIGIYDLGPEGFAIDESGPAPEDSDPATVE